MIVTAVFPIESLPETREAGQPVHRETRDVGVQISGTHTDECTGSRPGKSHLTDRSSGLVRPNTHAEELFRVVSWVQFPDGMGLSESSNIQSSSVTVSCLALSSW